MFCPLCNQRWVGKQPNLGWKQPSTFESVGNCYYRSTRKSIQTIFSDVGSLVKTCAKVRCLGVTFVSKTADRSACFDWLIDHVFGWRVHFIINKPDNKVLSSKRNKRFCNLCTGNLIGDEYHILFECKNQIITANRKKFLPRYYISHPSMFKCIELLQISNEKVLSKLGVFFSVVLPLFK